MRDYKSCGECAGYVCHLVPELSFCLHAQSCLSALQSPVKALIGVQAYMFVCVCVLAQSVVMVTKSKEVC